MVLVLSLAIGRRWVVSIVGLGGGGGGGRIGGRVVLGVVHPVIGKK